MFDGEPKKFYTYPAPSKQNMGQVCKCETETHAERGFGLGAAAGGAEDFEDLAWPARPATAAPRGVPPMLAEATGAADDLAAEA